MMMFESGIDAILYIAKTLDNTGELEDESRHEQYVMEPKIPAKVDPAGEDSVLYTRRNISESSPSNDSLSDDAGVNTANISSGFENSSSDNDMPMEIDHDSVRTDIMKKAADIQHLGDVVANNSSDSENSRNSANEQPIEIESDSIQTKIDNDSSAFKKTSDIQNPGAENVSRIQSYSTTVGENSASVENGAYEISERTSNHNNILIREQIHHPIENGIGTSVSDSICERGPDSENKLTCEREEVKCKRAGVHIYSESPTDSHEIHVKENGKSNEIQVKLIEHSACMYSKSSTNKDNSNTLIDGAAVLVTSSDTKKKCSVNRKIVKQKPYDRKKLNVGVAEDIRKLNHLVQLARKKNRERRKLKGTNQCNSKQSPPFPKNVSENSKKDILVKSADTTADTPKDTDKPPPLLVKIVIPRASQSEAEPKASVDGTGKRIPKKRTFKEFLGLDVTDKQDAKKIRHPWERRPRKKSKEEYRLLREAKKTKKEERLRRERMMERQKELDERYLVIEEESKPSAEPDNDKADKPDNDTNTAPHIPVVKRYVLDEDRETNEVLIEIDPVLLAKLKPHQVEAVRFMYDCCVESIEQLYLSDGGGCILAHCMGLGKTLSVISFVYTLMSNKRLTSMEKCLIVCPLNTVKNWVNEFHKWTHDLSCKIKVYELSNVKESKKRGEMLNDWNASGGVMILGYEMYRNLVQVGKGKVRVQKETYTDILANPGPDLVICDEGHILKNSKSMSYKAMNRIRTRRRVILTGTPLQNNLKEYYHMVNYVKPLLLSTMKNFQQRFIDPIMNGQCKDSSPEQIDWMKKRVHVLHRILGGCVQRKDYSALTKFLPPKHEYVISVRMGSKQCTLYELYLQLTGVDGIRKVLGRNARLFKDYQSLMKIWTHPWLLTQETNSKKESKQKAGKDKNRDMYGRMSASQSPVIERDNNPEISDEIVELEQKPKEGLAVMGVSSREEPASETSDIEVENANDNYTESQSTETNEMHNVNYLAAENGDSNIAADSGNALNQDEESSALIHIPESNSPQDSYDIEDLLGDWWKDEVTLSDGEDMTLSGKIVLLFEILDMCRKCGDKLLVFSQSIPSLNLIEGFLKMINKFENGGKKKETGMNTWVRDKDYFRIDGSTSAQKRKEVQKSFNDPENKRANLFLISTKAGSLGTNLVAANRVIIFDASWNPSHDVQSIFRVYRFGQTKPVYVYRFLAQGTMEEKIYERQVTKQSLSQRVIDEHQIERHFTMADLQALYRFTPDRLDDPDREDRPLPVLPKDELLATLMTTQKDWIVTFHEHDSLLENMEEQELTEEEKKAAWDEYERKALKIFRTPEPEQKNDGDQSQDSVQFINYLQNGDGNQASYGSLPPIEQAVLDEWFNKPEHTELLDTLRDIIPDVLMEGDQNNDNADNTNNAGQNSHVEQGIQSTSNIGVHVNYAYNFGMNVNNNGAFFNPTGLEISAMRNESATQNIESKPIDTKITVESPPDKIFQAETKENSSPVLKLPNIIFGMGENYNSSATEKSLDSTFQTSNNQTVPLNLSISKHAQITNFTSNQQTILQRNLDTPDLVVVDNRQENTTDRISESLMTKSTYVYKKPKQRMLERLLFDSQTSCPSSLTLRSSPGSDSSESPSRSPYVLPSPVMISSSPPSPPTPPSPPSPPSPQTPPSPSPLTLPSRDPLNLSTSPMSPYVPIPSQMTSSLSSQSSPVPSPNKVPILTRHSPDDNQNVDLEQSNFAENRLVIDLEQTDEASESVHDSNVKGVNKKLDSKPVSPSNLKSENRSMDTITSAHTSSNPVNLKESKIELQKTSSSMEAPAPILIPLTVVQNDTDLSPNHTSAAVPSQGSFMFAPIKSGEYEDISDLCDADDA